MEFEQVTSKLLKNMYDKGFLPTGRELWKSSNDQWVANGLDKYNNVDPLKTKPMVIKNLEEALKKRDEIQNIKKVYQAFMAGLICSNVSPGEVNPLKVMAQIPTEYYGTIANGYKSLSQGKRDIVTKEEVNRNLKPIEIKAIDALLKYCVL